jgi:hypothetical protein
MLSVVYAGCCHTECRGAKFIALSSWYLIICQYKEQIGYGIRMLDGTVR